MKAFIFRATAILLLSSFAISANAATVTGNWLVADAWSLIHDSATPSASSPGDFLRWGTGETISLDLTGTTLTAIGTPSYTLGSTNGASATFTVQDLLLDLSGPSGTLAYSLDVTGGPLDGCSPCVGTLTFAAETFGGPFNSFANNELFLWGGDTENDLGIDIGIQVVPIPAPLLLFASGLFGLGFMRRRG